MLFEFDNGLLLTVHGEGAPTDSEWNAYADCAIRNAASTRCIIILSEGGGPNAKQRQRIARADAVKTLPTLVMSTSSLVRGMVTALGWLGKSIKACAPADAERIGAFVDLDRSTADRALCHIASLKLALAGRPGDTHLALHEALLFIKTPFSELAQSASK